MNATVFENIFIFEHNRLEAAEQEYNLAREEYEAANRAYDPFDPKKVAAFHSARERRGRAWEAWWKMKRESGW